MLEGRKEEAYKNYKDVIEQEREEWGGVPTAYDEFVSEDPSGNHKYLDWLMKMWYGGEAKQSVFGVLDLIQLVEAFHKYSSQLDKKDINQWKDLGELDHAIGEIEQKGITKQEEKKVIKVDSGHPDYDVYIPQTWEASCKYGMGTKWCTSMKDTRNYYMDYTADGVLYYIIDKKKKEDHPLYKIAVYVKSNPKTAAVWGNKEIFNAPDKNIGNKLEYFVPQVVNNSIHDHWLQYDKIEREDFDYYSVIQNTLGADVRTYEKWKYSSDAMTGSIEWWSDEPSGENLSVYATPFWEDMEGIPVDVDFSIADKNYSSREHTLTPESVSFIQVKTDFKNPTELRQWFNTEYPKLVSDKIKQILKTIVYNSIDQIKWDIMNMYDDTAEIETVINYRDIADAFVYDDGTVLVPIVTEPFQVLSVNQLDDKVADEEIRFHDWISEGVVTLKVYDVSDAFEGSGGDVISKKQKEYIDGIFDSMHEWGNMNIHGERMYEWWDDVMGDLEILINEEWDDNKEEVKDTIYKDILPRFYDVGLGWAFRRYDSLYDLLVKLTIALGKSPL